MGIPAGGGTGRSCGRVVAAVASLVLLIQLISGCVSPAAAAGGGGEQHGAKYKDPRQPLPARVDDLLRRMTLAEKIGQMSQIDQENATAAVISSYWVVTLRGGGSVPAADAPPEVWVEMVDAIQRAALSTRLGIPAMFGIDAVHGYVYKATVFPHNVGLGCTRVPELAKKIGAAVALEVRATGIPFIFAPCLAVCRDPRWGRCYESFSEDPKLVEQMTSIISGFQGEIPASGRRGAHGGTTRGINENNTVATFHQLLGIHMPPYYSAVIQGVSCLHHHGLVLQLERVKMHANRFLVTDFLKNKLRFRGFVISDWLGLDRITSPEHADYPLSIKLGILAGIDMVMIPYQYKEFRDDLTTLVQNGTIPMSRIDDAAHRILRIKFTSGLFSRTPTPTPASPASSGSRSTATWRARPCASPSSCSRTESPATSRSCRCRRRPTAASSSPAATPTTSAASAAAGQIKWQGLTGNNLTAGTTILDGIKRTVGPAGTDVVYAESPDTGFIQRSKGRFDHAVVVVGEHPYAETAGDNLNQTIPAPGPAVIRNVCAGIRCVVVLVSGRPLVVEPYIDAVDALVAAWLPHLAPRRGYNDAPVITGQYGAHQTPF
ncbi:hypothetical protein PVAP13_1KG358777 [Panicum virgatum]|uniref:Beta-glucosidase n=1 Tax=Panicum virgatum TaxID=38727 RepID=A0A8T0X8K8_PANVG|nr:hypothetical protein PVAP13_1KG358777 [Panicum virgatum]